MKIYTKTGDSGETSLFGGKRVSKADIRVDAYGTIDELNSFLGLLICKIDDVKSLTLLSKIQNNLFVVGGQLATEPEATFKLPEINEEDVTELELAIDSMNDYLPALKHFILPGGNEAVSYCNICRTITRRAERIIVCIEDKDDQQKLIVKYVNRLSDYYFVLGRYLGHLSGIEEVIWVGRG
jgi:cob(I)alamin adenosyltransferase